MKPRWPEVRAAFEQALELAPAQRTTWLDRELGVDGELRAEVDRLLRHDATGSAFLEPPGALTLGDPTGKNPLAPGRRFGPFVLCSLLGSGGMGSVYVAEQERPNRRVALKVLRAPLDAGQTRARFEAEVEALARLQHPGIAQVYEAGIESDGTCWFAMELIEHARPLTQQQWSVGTSTTQRLEMFVRVAAAVHHAHQRGVIHRDLKPANILVDQDGTPKVIDFGIARSTTADDRQLTEAGQLLGTLAYMSPEQVEGRDTDVRTDVYGLGVVLYELLTGQPPFDVRRQPLTEACRLLVEQDPPPASTQAAGLPIELDWMLDKALQKQARERYAGVAEFAADVERFLHHEPVLAAPPSTTYRLRKFVRRHRVGVATATSVLLVTIAALVMITMALLRTQTAEAKERDGRALAEAAATRAAAASDFLLDVFSSVEPGNDGREVKMADALARAARDVGERLADQPGLRGALGHTIGMAFFGLGIFDESATHLRQSVEAEEIAHGKDDVEVARVLVDLCLVLERRGDTAEAEQVLERAEHIVAALPDTELVKAEATTRRADMLLANGDRAAAKSLLEPLVARLRTLRGPQDRSTLLATNLLAVVRHQMGDLEAAEALYRETYAGCCAVKGEDHPESLTALNNLMMVQYSRGERRELLPTLERLLAVRRRVLGNDHPDTIGNINNLAGVYFGLREFGQAATFYKEAAQRLGEREGKGHPAYATIVANLAAAERGLGDYPHAIEHATEALELRRQRLGPSHEETLLAQALLADVHRFAGEHELALTMFEQCRQLAAAATPPQLANIYRCDLGIGRALMSLHRFEQSEAALLRCRDRFAAVDKAAAVKGQLVRPDDNLHELYVEWGKPEQAAKFETNGK